MSPVASDYLHLGCGLTTPPGWIHTDGSWQVVLARFPLMKRLLVRIGLISKNQADIPWSPDVLRLDLRKRLPFANNRFRVVYSSHTLEHLYRAEALALLKECFRVLGADGVCRIVVPDVKRCIDRYLVAKNAGEPNAADQLMEHLRMHERSPVSGLFGLYRKLTSYHLHKWMYDADSLAGLMKEAGFYNV